MLFVAVLFFTMPGGAFAEPLLYLRLFPRRFPEVFWSVAEAICRIVGSGDDLLSGERLRMEGG